MESIGHLLEQSSLLHSHRPFLIFERKKLSFNEVDRRVNQAANALRKLGVARGDKVSVMLPNGFDFPISWLAIAKLGAVIVSPSITYKEYDLAYILSDSDSSAIILHRDCLPVLEAVKPKLPLLKTVIVAGAESPGYHNFSELIERASGIFTIRNVGEADLLNIQYTSGTTGFPKGCMLTHRYWLFFGKAIIDFYELTPGDIDLTAQPFNYLDPQWNAVVCLMAGIPLVIMERFSPSKFWPAVKENNVTFFYVMGTMPLFLLKQEENPEWEKNHKLRFVVCSGIVPQLHATFEKRWNVRWREAYGSTESGGDLSVPLSDAESVGSGSVGIPLSTKEAKIVDERGDEVPEGQIGELLVRGEPMMTGYWKKSEATAEAFRNGWRRRQNLALKMKKPVFYKDSQKRCISIFSQLSVQ